MVGSKRCPVRDVYKRQRQVREIFYTGRRRPESGLGGCRVFCNPPYGRQITDWVRKGYEESKKPGTLVVMLIPARTDTSYFHDYIFHGKADEVRFIRGRLTFTDEDGNPTKDAKGRPCSAPFPSAVVIWRSKDMAQSCLLYTSQCVRI